MRPTALIADDEPLLAEDLKRRLAALWPELEIGAVCHDGPAALSRLEADKPDIAFLDIRMPGMSGLEVAARLDFPCRLVFVTAYDQYAVEAFERAAVDYGERRVRHHGLPRRERPRAAQPARPAGAARG